MPLILAYFNRLGRQKRPIRVFHLLWRRLLLLRHHLGCLRHRMTADKSRSVFFESMSRLFHSRNPLVGEKNRESRCPCEFSHNG